MKTLKRHLLRPIYAIYWLYIVVRCLFNKHKIKYYLLDFNTWLERNGFWRLSTKLSNLKIIVPKEYRDFIKKYPKLSKYNYIGEVDPHFKPIEKV